MTATEAIFTLIGCLVGIVLLIAVWEHLLDLAFEGVRRLAQWLESMLG